LVGWLDTTRDKSDQSSGNSSAVFYQPLYEERLTPQPVVYGLKLTSAHHRTVKSYVYWRI